MLTRQFEFIMYIVQSIRQLKCVYRMNIYYRIALFKAHKIIYMELLAFSIFFQHEYIISMDIKYAHFIQNCVYIRIWK